MRVRDGAGTRQRGATGVSSGLLTYGSLLQLLLDAVDRLLLLADRCLARPATTITVQRPSTALCSLLCIPSALALLHLLTLGSVDDASDSLGVINDKVIDVIVVDDVRVRRLDHLDRLL